MTGGCEMLCIFKVLGKFVVPTIKITLPTSLKLEGLLDFDHKTKSDKGHLLLSLDILY